MSKSPGHRQWPEHEVHEEPLDYKVNVTVDDEIIAESNDVIKVDEDDCPVRYYFRRDDVRMGMLEPSATTTECPFKGTASYFNIRIGDKKLPDAVWSYEHPYDEHHELQGRLAFYDDKVPGINIQPRL